MWYRFVRLLDPLSEVWTDSRYLRFFRGSNSSHLTDRCEFYYICYSYLLSFWVILKPRADLLVLEAYIQAIRWVEATVRSRRQLVWGTWRSKNRQKVPLMAGLIIFPFQFGCCWAQFLGFLSNSFMLVTNLSTFGAQEASSTRIRKQWQSRYLSLSYWS